MPRISLFHTQPSPAHSSPHLPTHPLTCPLVPSPAHSSPHLPTRPPHLPTRPLTCPLVPSPAHSSPHLPTHPLTCPLIPSPLRLLMSCSVRTCEVPSSWSFLLSEPHSSPVHKIITHQNLNTNTKLGGNPGVWEVYLSQRYC